MLLKINGAVFEGVDFSNANLKSAEFLHSKISNLKLQGAYLDMNDFRGVDLRKISFSGANLDDPRLSGANMQGMDLSQAVGVRIFTYVRYES